MTGGSSAGRKRIDSVDVLVVSWNGRHHLETLLPVLEAQQVPGVAVRVRLFDNGSTDGTVTWIRSRHPHVDVVVNPTNIGFSAANNRLAEKSGASALAMVNNDTRPRPDWLARLVAGLAEAPADVAAVSGGIVNWKGTRLDFGRGVMTFDGHAFQLDYHRPLDAVEMPEEGCELLFPCGGNMIVRRDSYLAAGGFDESYFAYLEDVDLGWRLWSAGERVLSAPGAVVHHRSMATSKLLGNANRGLLFERNAYLTAFKNYDAELWPQLMPVVQMTLIGRVQHLLANRNPHGQELAVDPYAAVVDGQGASLAGDSGPRDAWERLRHIVALRTRLRRFARPHSGLPDGVPAIVDDQTLAQVRAVSSIIRGLDDAAERRRRIQARRQRPDAEIFERFPLYVVPTYPGDEELFRSSGFEAMWPEGLPLVRRSLEEVMEVER
ncbi:MAG: glycosyltransferase family 2 protein [Holophagales bacterium]|nr:glycosyltransferase family 2 protein [Holophagales bacterium]MXX62279.1 glycosyltransferase family 2 protein [Holophagales bacterium]MYC09349.1 glycosyltransferase family 2 protein [Holophagales bacterium]MYD23135.1 glycosyltransferase family 2 protein [Holophagales bacterium]MYI34300.1 glycosyltransferase family 2 protein [Holophagales bacterium]